MPRRKAPLAKEVIAAEMDALERCVRNLLLENKNFANGYYVREYSRTSQFISGPLKEMAQHILSRIDEARELAVDMAADD